MNEIGDSPAERKQTVNTADQAAGGRGGLSLCERESESERDTSRHEEGRQAERRGAAHRGTFVLEDTLGKAKKAKSKAKRGCVCWFEGASQHSGSRGGTEAERLAFDLVARPGLLHLARATEAWKDHNYDAVSKVVHALKSVRMGHG